MWRFLVEEWTRFLWYSTSSNSYILFLSFKNTTVPDALETRFFSYQIKEATVGTTTHTITA